MSQWLMWERAVSFGKGLVVICAFLAFAISIRQKELDRFVSIKPLYEIKASTNANSFKLINHGSIVYFIGCDEQNAGKILTKTPRRYSTLRNNNQSVEFQFSKRLSDNDFMVSYWRDIDLNTYTLKIKWHGDGFYIDGVPLAFRSDKFLTMSRKWLDSTTNFLFPKDWFSDKVPPKDCQLKVANGGIGLLCPE